LVPIMTWPRDQSPDVLGNLFTPALALNYKVGF
jgi:hypothetical protein